MNQPSLRLLVVLAAAALAMPGAARADQASQPSSPAAGHISAGEAHSCAVLTATARCWGFAGNGRLGYGTTASVGDDETPGSAGTIDVGAGAGVGVEEISAGEGHTCALLDNGSVRCWGFAGNGRLGYGNLNDIGDDESPASAGAVQLGGTAKSISAGDSHTCALLVDGSVRCWGYGLSGALGYGNEQSIGDDETPASAGAVAVGGAVTAISAGGAHTCALLTGGSVRCWGAGGRGQLGYDARDDADDENPRIGDDETPSSVAVLKLGAGRTATAISAGLQHTCAVLDDETIRCWGENFHGQLGLANTNTVGLTQSPGDVGPVDLGPGAGAKAVIAGGQHSCAILGNGSVRCWGRGDFGQLGYASTSNVGDDEPPSAAGPVMLGAGRTALAADGGSFHTCVLLDDQAVRCWGFGSNGRLGYCNEANVGDSEVPGAVGPVDLAAGGAGCAVAPPPPPPPPPRDGGTPVAPPVTPPPAPPVGGGAAVDPFAREAERRRALRSCLRSAARGSKRARSRARRACMARYARRPGRVRGLRARAVGRTKVVLTFIAPGTDALRAPAARGYLVRQSTRPIRTARDFARAAALCRGSCRFRPEAVGTRITLTVTGLSPRTTYYYAVAARDNVTNRLGRRSSAVRVRTR